MQLTPVVEKMFAHSGGGSSPFLRPPPFTARVTKPPPPPNPPPPMVVVFMSGHFRPHPMAQKKGGCGAPPRPPIGKNYSDANVNDDTSQESKSEL